MSDRCRFRWENEVYDVLVWGIDWRGSLTGTPYTMEEERRLIPPQILYSGIRDYLYAVSLFHTVITSSGDLRGAGYNYQRILKPGELSSPDLTLPPSPRTIHLYDQAGIITTGVKKIGFLGSNIIVLGFDGDIYSWGWVGTNNGVPTLANIELHAGAIIEPILEGSAAVAQINTNYKIIEGKRIVDIKTTDNLAVAIADNGDLWAFGEAIRLYYPGSPTGPVLLATNVKDANLGYYGNGRAIGVINRDDELYFLSIGSGGSGNIALGDLDIVIPTGFSKLDPFPIVATDVKKVVLSGDHHSPCYLFLKNNGDLHGWGRSESHFWTATEPEGIEEHNVSTSYEELLNTEVVLRTGVKDFNTLWDAFVYVLDNEYNMRGWGVNIWYTHPHIGTTGLGNPHSTDKYFNGDGIIEKGIVGFPDTNHQIAFYKAASGGYTTPPCGQSYADYTNIKSESEFISSSIPVPLQARDLNRPDFSVVFDLENLSGIAQVDSISIKAIGSRTSRLDSFVDPYLDSGLINDGCIGNGAKEHGPFAAAAGNPLINITTEETFPWVIDIGGVASGDITHNQKTSMFASIAGPAILTFQWSVSSEYKYDLLEFYLNGVKQSSISGVRDFAAYTQAIPDGINTIEWRYMKDSSVSAGLDKGWVRNISVNPLIATGKIRQHVVVGREGTIRYSNDNGVSWSDAFLKGKNWSIGDPSTIIKKDFRAVSFSPNQGYVAVGDGGIIFSSNDGMVWNEQQNSGVGLYAITSVSQRVIAAGALGTSAVRVNNLWLDRGVR